MLIYINKYLKTLLFIMIASVSNVHAAERSKIGLVLSGGGARGIAHIGVLKELERQRIPIDYITGTSMGSIIGALYASGHSIAEIEEILAEIDWLDIFADAPPRRNASIRRKFDDDIFQVSRELGFKDGKIKIPSGLIRGQKLQLLLDKLFLHTANTNNFDQLGIPFRAVATDIATGQPVVLGDGSLATAIRASMSVPGAFTTVKHQGYTLVDGGISNNMPVDVARQMGADVVIAVDIGSPLLEDDSLETFLGVTLQMTNMLVRNTTQYQISTLVDKDILIVPQLGTYSSSDFEGAGQTIVKGVEATSNLQERLAPLALSETEMAARSQQRQNKDTLPALISSVSLNNLSSFNDQYILSRISQRLNTELDFDQLELDIGNIYGLGTFESITYDIVAEQEQSELIINVVEKAWGPRYLQFGLRYESQVTNNNELSGVLGYTVTPLNAFNGEWRTILQFGEEPGAISELHQPLARNSSYFLNTNITY
ncbi:MAG: patatin-like phospholipase family protein, partial [bacterium]